MSQTSANGSFAIRLVMLVLFVVVMTLVRCGMAVREHYEEATLRQALQEKQLAAQEASVRAQWQAQLVANMAAMASSGAAVPASAASNTIAP